MTSSFATEPETNFADPTSVTAFERALRGVKGSLGQRHPMVVDNKEVRGSAWFTSSSPAAPSLVVGEAVDAGAAIASEALAAAERAFPAWSRTPAADRARYLVEAAGRIRQLRHELAAWMLYEVGKSWAEADGEVAECIDLLEYYAQQMLALDGPQTGRLGRLTNEHTDFFYIPLGAGVVISPWNFPLALTFGMACAAIVAGNTVVIKPASNSPISVLRLARVFREIGLPPGVLNVVTGRGSVIGNVLVDHPRTRFVAFTGSLEVGVALHERAAKLQPGQIWIKRTVLELGGKNAVIVDADADLESAADGVVASAFGFQGQKCSAGSRAIIDDAVYAELLELVSARVATLPTGDPLDRSVVVGPVIDDRACRSILQYIDVGRTEGRLIAGGARSSLDSYLIQPTVFADVAPDARIAQEEIFGPVLACLRASDFDDALRIANGTKYGLTGAVFSRNRAKLEQARREFHVGNLYFNRKSTGALMGVHPFGGFNLSGTDSKAGGPDYLLHFLQGKSVGDRVA